MRSQTNVEVGAALNLLEIVDELTTIGALFDCAELAACEACTDPSDQNAIMAVMGVGHERLMALRTRIDEGRVKLHARIADALNSRL
jgi:hypothetical protein